MYIVLRHINFTYTVIQWKLNIDGTLFNPFYATGFLRCIADITLNKQILTAGWRHIVVMLPQFILIKDMTNNTNDVWPYT